MIADYRYKLQKGSKKYVCPDCDKKTLVRFIDTKTDDLLSGNFGRCDRESKCGFFIIPDSKVTGYIPKMIVPKKKTFIPIEILKQTLKGYESNTFIQNLLKNIPYPFKNSDIESVISLYRLGTIINGYRSNSITLPFIDIKNQVCAIQVKQFDKDNHTTGTDFLHSIINKHHIRNSINKPQWLVDYNDNELKVSCLFGEHLLSKYPYNPIALVEAPKTALYGMLYFGAPENINNFIWLGVYNLSSLNLEKCKVLKGRNICLFPDTSTGGKAFDLWTSKANEISKKLDTKFQVSDLLEKNTNQKDKDKGTDIADYLIKQDWREYRTSEIDKLEKYFNSIQLPDEIDLVSGFTVTRVKEFIDANIKIIKRYSEDDNKPFLDRLKDIKNVVEYYNKMILI